MNVEPPAWKQSLLGEYPFASHFLDLQGLRYHYLDEGAGDPIVFVHGNPTWSFAWRRFVRDLSRDHRTLAVDHIGCGMSDKPQAYCYRLAEHIANLRFWLKSLDLKRVTLVAHDWGGAIGMGAVVAEPERFSRIILCNTAAFRSKRIPLRIAACRIPGFGDLCIRGLNGFARAALTMAVSHPEKLTPAIRAGYLAPYNSWANRIATLRFVQDIPLAPQHPSYQTLLEIEQGLSKIELQSMPMLLAWGDQDWCFTPDFRREFQLRFPRAEVFAMPDAGHYLFEDAPDRLLARIRQFLSEHPLPSTSNS